MRLPRLIILLIGCGVLAAAFLLDAPEQSVADQSNPFVVSARPYSTADEFDSTWICPVLQSADLGVDTEAQLVLVNPLDSEQTARITFDGRSTPSEITVLKLAPLSRTVVDDSELPDESERAALVEVSHRSVVVARTFQAEQGEDTAPCSNQISSQMVVASGSTRLDARQVLVLHNPFAEDAVVDIVAASDAEFGFFAAGELEGIVVPAGSIHTVSIDAAVRRRDLLSLFVTLRKGRVVADRLMQFDGSEERRGFSADLASPAMSDVWYVPVGPRTEIEQLVLFNPGDVPAEVDVEFQAGDTFVPPLQRTVPPTDFVVVDIPAESPSLETGAQHGMVIRTQNGVDIAVDLIAGEDLEAAQLLDRLASFDMSATANRSAREWIVPTLRVDEFVTGVLVIQNPTDASVEVSVDALSGGSRSTLQALVLAPRSVEVVSLDVESDVALVVTGTGEIVVASALSEERPAAAGWAPAVPVVDSE